MGWLVYWLTVAEAVVKAFKEVPPPERRNVSLPHPTMVSRLCVGGKIDGKYRMVHPDATGMAIGTDTYRLVVKGDDSYFVSEEMSQPEFERFHREVLTPCTGTRA